MTSFKLPPALLSSLEGLKGFDKSAFEAIHASDEQAVSVRLNPKKWKILKADEKAGGMISQSIAESQKVPWSSYGYYLPSRPFFTQDPHLHAGLYYVQEASGLFLEQAIRQSVDLNNSIRVLDLCAAPGGKSTLLQSIISVESLLVSNEVIKTRATILLENMIKWGPHNVIVTNNDPADFSRLPNFFDVMIIDAPCSGSGLFRRDPEAIGEWSEANVKLCSQRQQRILAEAWPALKEDGLLVYCTCSYSKEENEDIVDWILGQLAFEPIQLSLDPNWNIVESISDRHQGYGYRFYPDQTRGEGFFLACLRKKNGGTFSFPKFKKPGWESVSSLQEKEISEYLVNEFPLKYSRQGDLVYAFPANLVQDFNVVHQNLYLKKAGILLGKLLQKELIPEQDLATSCLAGTLFQRISLNNEQAIKYLRKEDFNLESNIKGWALVEYLGLPLGWIKILQSRFNNYYPRNWRIMQSMADLSE
ncbi:MAG: RNA methyltransferase [Bacteroidetes bacterium]|nr:MAG: RNA methyltransferase [Bacteroidota bacterium]